MSKAQILILSALFLLVVSCGGGNGNTPISTTPAGQPGGDPTTGTNQQAMNNCVNASCIGRNGFESGILCIALETTTTIFYVTNSQSCQNFQLVLALNCEAQACNSNPADQNALTLAYAACLEGYSAQSVAACPL